MTSDLAGGLSDGVAVGCYSILGQILRPSHRLSQPGIVCSVEVSSYGVETLVIEIYNRIVHCQANLVICISLQPKFPASISLFYELIMCVENPIIWMNIIRKMINNISGVLLASLQHLLLISGAALPGVFGTRAFFSKNW